MSLLKLSKHYAEKYIKGKNWENITDEGFILTFRTFSVRFCTCYVRFWYDFGMFWWRESDEKVFVRVVYGNLYEMCKRNISLHLSSISFNREKKRLFEKKRYGEFIFRIWNDSSQVPTKKSQFYKKKTFFYIQRKNQIRYLE